MVASAVDFGQRNPAAPPETAQLDWMIGNWDIVSKDLQPDGSHTTSKARMTIYYVLDGFAIQEDFRALDQQGKVVFRGMAVRSFDPVAKQWTITWLMANVPGITEVIGEFKDGQFIQTGKGFDGMGKFISRATYSGIGPDHFSFKLDRSYDNGKTWLEGFNLIEAERME